MSGRTAMGRVLWCVALTLAGAAGCGGPPPAEVPQGGGEAPPPSSVGSWLNVQSEVGAMNEDATQRTFQRAATKLSRCFERGTKRVPYLGGEIRLAVRVATDGSARWAYVKDSTLGDRETEECMLGVVKSTTWPKPLGGEGLAESSFTFEPNADERPPVDWAPEELGKPFKKAQGTLAACRSEAGTGPLKATLYVDTDGKAVAVGVATADEKGEAAVACVVDALRGITFPSPGSYAAKVTVTIE